MGTNANNVAPNLNEEQFGEQFPQLRKLARGYSWKMRHRHPAFHGFLVFAVAASSGYIACQVAYNHLIPVLYDAIGFGDLADAFLSQLMRWIISVGFGAAFFVSVHEFWEFVRNLFFAKAASKLTLEERIAIAKEIVGNAYSIELESIYDQAQVERALEHGLSKEDAISEIEGALDHLRKRIFATSEQLLSNDQKVVNGALKRLVNDDKFSLYSKMRKLRLATAGMNDVVERAIASKQLHDDVQARKAEIRKVVEASGHSVPTGASS